MLDKLTKKSFDEHMDTVFNIHLESSEVIDVQLTETSEKHYDHSECFSLIFTGPKDKALPQKIYKMEHGKMGTLEIFLVPISQTESGVEYEAVFNRPIKP